MEKKAKSVLNYRSDDCLIKKNLTQKDISVVTNKLGERDIPWKQSHFYSIQVKQIFGSISNVERPFDNVLFSLLLDQKNHNNTMNKQYSLVIHTLDMLANVLVFSNMLFELMISFFSKIDGYFVH